MMQLTQSITEAGASSSYLLVLSMNEQRMIRKAVSDISIEIERYKLRDGDDEDGDVEIMKKIKEEEEVKQVECKCCGLKEECTKGYIVDIERSFCGKWVCGLCSEAVKDIILKKNNSQNPNPTPNNYTITIDEEAINSHRDFYNQFNSTTRLNPKLSLTTSLKHLAIRSCRKRRHSNDASNSKLPRSISCDPTIRP